VKLKLRLPRLSWATEEPPREGHTSDPLVDLHPWHLETSLDLLYEEEIDARTVPVPRLGRR
jgi:hypothetical protein